jgi:class 3 adenylate cyclase
MHSGSVHAGVVGTRRPHYCFFGETVDTANCMERTSFPMAVHVSDTTAALLKKSESSVETILLVRSSAGKSVRVVLRHISLLCKVFFTSRVLGLGIGVEDLIFRAQN